MQQTLSESELTTLRGRFVWPFQEWQGAQAYRVYLNALAWQQTGDRAFAGKGIGGLWTFPCNYQKDWFDGMEIIGFGDGVRKTFPLRADTHGSYADAVQGKISPRQTKACTKSAGDTDDVSFYSDFVCVWDDGGEYLIGVDWVHSGDVGNNLMRWLPNGARPAVGGKFNVEFTSRIDAPFWRHKPINNTVTFTEPIAKGSAVYAYYCYSPPGGLPFQETLGGLGGFNLILVDQSFVAKFLDDVIRALTILRKHPEFPPALLALYDDLIPRWQDYIRDYGYMRGYLPSNYGIGGESFRGHAAFYLKDHGHPRGDEIVAEMTAAWRKMTPQVTGPAPSLRGGFWSEGWNYGAASVRRILDVALLFEAHGVDASELRSWAKDVALHLAHAAPGNSWLHVYDGGDHFAEDGTARFPAELAGYLDEFGTPVSKDRSTLPTDHFCEGTGLLLSRTDWGPDSMMVSVQAGRLLACDHQQHTQGQIQIWLGDQPFLMNGPVLLNDQSGARKSAKGNIPIVDCQERTIQTYPRAQGLWEGTHEFWISKTLGQTRTEGTLNLGPAWSHNSAPGAGGPVEFSWRNFAFLKSKRAVVVYDRLGLRGDWPWWIQWCLYHEPDADGWRKMTLGNRTLYVLGLSPDGLVETGDGADGRFLRHSVGGKRGKVISVFAADRKPVVVLDGHTLRIDGEIVGLAADWPPSIVAPPLPPPGPGPGPGPTPPPTRPMPQPIYTLDATTYTPAPAPTVGPIVVPNAYNGWPILRLGPNDRIDLGDLLKDATELSVVVLCRKLVDQPGAYNFEVVGRKGQFGVECFHSVKGMEGKFTTAGGVNSITAYGEVGEFHVWAVSYRNAPEGMVAGCDAVAKTGNASKPGPLLPGTGPLIVNGGGGAQEVVAIDFFVGLTKVETIEALSRLTARYAAAPKPPDPPPPPIPPDPDVSDWEVTIKTADSETTVKVRGKKPTITWKED